MLDVIDEEPVTKRMKQSEDVNKNSTKKNKLIRGKLLHSPSKNSFALATGALLAGIALMDNMNLDNPIS